MAEMKSIRLQDPREKYPKPTFPKQRQDLPGSEKAMEPEADHGEKSYRGSGKLRGLATLITGGDSGIGRAVAIAYAREGADVAFSYLEEEADARITKDLIEAEGRRALAFKMDQSKRADCDHVVESVVKSWGRLDVLVNNAGIQKSYESLEEIPDDEFARVFEVNIEPFFYFSRAALKHLPPGGSIINTTSIQAFTPSANLAPYAATKAAIANFTLSLAELAMEKGVRVNAVAPGPVWTPLIPASMPQEKVQHFGENTVFKRAAQPAELAPVYVFLASEDASYVTGEIYGVTGGRRPL